MDRDIAGPARPPFMRRPAARWAIVPLIGIVLAGVLIVALNGFFRHCAASSPASFVRSVGKPVYLTWADQQGDALGARDGANGHLLWRDAIEGIINGAPVGLTLADGTLYLYGAVQGTVSQTLVFNTLTAIRAGDGHVLWHATLPGETPDPYLAPIVANGIIYATQMEQTSGIPTSIISAFRITDGHKLWEYAPGLRMTALPVRANTLYLVEGAQTGAPLSTQVEAVNATTGQRLWRSALMEGDGGGAMLGSTSMLVTTTQSQKVISGSGPPVFAATGILHVFDLATGKHLWEVSGGREIQATFDATGTTIFATITNGATYVTQPRFPPSFVTAYNAQTGTKLWQYTTDGAPSAPVVAGTLVYFTCALSASIASPDASTLTALDAGTGKQQWHVANALPPVANSGYSTGSVTSPQVQQGTVFTFLLSATDETMVNAFDALSGHLRWSVDVGHIDSLGHPIGTQFPEGPESLLVTAGTVYAVAGNERATTVINAGDGKTLWTFTTKQNTASLIVGV